MKLKYLKYFANLYPEHEVDIAFDPSRFIITGVSFEDEDQRKIDEITIFEDGRYEIETITEYYDVLGEMEYAKLDRWKGNVEDFKES